MKISKLVTKLEELKAVYGDLEVEYVDPDGFKDITHKIYSVAPRHPFKADRSGSDTTQPPSQIDLW
jgi:hypothetical protein